MACLSSAGEYCFNSGVQFWTPSDQDELSDMPADILMTWCIGKDSNTEMVLL
jgi:hypothetical protein